MLFARVATGRASENLGLVQLALSRLAVLLALAFPV